MNMFIEEGSELDELKLTIAEWAKKLPEDYDPERLVPGLKTTEECFYTLAKRIANLEIQNKENAKLKLTDFSIGDIIWYLMENEGVKAVLYVDDSHEYEIKTNYSHIHGSGENRIIIVR